MSIKNSNDFPEELQHIATSLKLITGKPVDRAQLIAKILGFLEIYTDDVREARFRPNQVVMGRLFKYDWETDTCRDVE